MFNRRSSPYLLLISMCALIFVIYLFWGEMNIVFVVFVYLVGSVAATSVVFLWDNLNRKKIILRLARNMTFSFGGTGPLALVEDVIPERSSTSVDSTVLTIVLRGYATDTSVIVVNVGVKKSGVSATASIKMTEGLPLFRLRPKGNQEAGSYSNLVREKIGMKFSGGKTVDFTDSAEFSENYNLEAADDAVIRRLFSPSVLNFFAMRPNLAVDGGPWLVVTAALIKTPRELRRWLMQTCSIYNMFSAPDCPSLDMSVNYSNAIARHQEQVRSA